MLKFLKKLLPYLFIFIFATTVIYIENATNNGSVDLDNTWTYHMSQKIYNGYAPYKEINMIITPLYYYGSALFMKLFQNNFVTYYLYGSSIIGFLFTVAYFAINKFIKNKGVRMLGAALIFFVCTEIFTPSYNALLVVFPYFLIVLELYRRKYSSNTKKGKIINVLIGIDLILGFLTKQTVGGMIGVGYFIYLIWYEKRIAVEAKVDEIKEKEKAELEAKEKSDADNSKLKIEENAELEAKEKSNTDNSKLKIEEKTNKNIKEIAVLGVTASSLDEISSEELKDNHDKVANVENTLNTKVPNDEKNNANLDVENTEKVKRKFSPIKFIKECFIAWRTNKKKYKVKVKLLEGIDFKGFGYKCIGAVLALLPFVITLIVNNSFGDFIDLCFGSILEFSEKNSSGNIFSEQGPWILYSIAISLMAGVMFKRKDIIFLSIMSVAVSTLIIPLYNSYHTYTALVFVFIVDIMLLDELININFLKKALKPITVLLGLAAVILFGVDAYKIVNEKCINFVANDAPERYSVYQGYNLSDAYYDKFDRVLDYIKEKSGEGFEVVFISSDASMYYITTGENHYKYDLLLTGNLGYNGEARMLEDIKNFEDPLFLIKKTDAFYQDSPEISKYIKQNYNRIDEIDDYYAYVKYQPGEVHIDYYQQDIDKENEEETFYIDDDEGEMIEDVVQIESEQQNVYDENGILQKLYDNRGNYVCPGTDLDGNEVVYYFDDYGNFVGGFDDEYGRFVGGYYDDDDNYVEYFYDEAGNYIRAHYDEVGNFVTEIIIEFAK